MCEPPVKKTMLCKILEELQEISRKLDHMRPPSGQIQWRCPKCGYYNNIDWVLCHRSGACCDGRRDL